MSLGLAPHGFGQYSAGSGVETKLNVCSGVLKVYRGPTSNVTFDEHAAQADLDGVNDARLWPPRSSGVGLFATQAVAPHARSGVEPSTASGQGHRESSNSPARRPGPFLTGVAALTCGDAIVSPPVVLALGAEHSSAALDSPRLKMLALRDLAQNARAWTLPSRAEMESLTNEAIVARLSAIGGIGRWSVETLLLFYLGRPDVFARS